MFKEVLLSAKSFVLSSSFVHHVSSEMNTCGLYTIAFTMHWDFKCLILLRIPLVYFHWYLKAWASRSALSCVEHKQRMSAPNRTAGSPTSLPGNQSHVFPRWTVAIREDWGALMRHWHVNQDRLASHQDWSCPLVLTGGFLVTISLPYSSIPFPSILFQGLGLLSFPCRCSETYQLINNLSTHKN